MKKIILSAMLFIGLCATTVNAQTSTSFGVKVNGNLMNVKVSESQTSDATFPAGGAIGGFAKIEFGANFALQPELLFNYTEVKFKTKGENVRFKYAAVEMPVYAIGQIKAGNGKIFAGVGPHIGYGFSIDSRMEKLDDNKLESNRFYMGGSTLAGYEFANGISVYTGYQMSIDIHSDIKKSDRKTHTISLGVGYKF